MTRATDQAATPPETIPVDSRTVACDGDSDPSGHPRVYLQMGAEDRVDCPYCGRRFVLAGEDAGRR